MPTIVRTRTLPAGREALWAVVSDPHHLPRWWPRVERVEEASAAAWTEVLRSPKGKSLRADFTRVRAEAPRRIVWRQEVTGSPFERILAEAVTEVLLEPAEAGSTRVQIRAVQRLRGFALLGSLLMRRSTKRILDEALDGLARIAVPSAGAEPRS